MASLGMVGPYEFSKEKIDEIVNQNRYGNYALGELNNGIFIVKYVGRTDEQWLNERISQHLGEASSLKYTHFKYIYEDDPVKRYYLECKNYHDFGENNHLLNKIHPDKPKEMNVECPFCLEDFINSEKK